MTLQEGSEEAWLGGLPLLVVVWAPAGLDKREALFR